MAASYSANFSWPSLGTSYFILARDSKMPVSLSWDRGMARETMSLARVELEHQLHHAQLLVQGHIGVDGVVGVLLEKATRKSLAVSMMSF